MATNFENGAGKFSFFFLKNDLFCKFHPKGCEWHLSTLLSLSARSVTVGALSCSLSTTESWYQIMLSFNSVRVFLNDATFWEQESLQNFIFLQSFIKMPKGKHLNKTERAIILEMRFDGFTPLQIASATQRSTGAVYSVFSDPWREEMSPRSGRPPLINAITKRHLWAGTPLLRSDPRLRCMKRHV